MAEDEKKGRSLMSGKVLASGAPVGKHRARFEDCVEVEPSETAIAEGWGPSMKLIWKLDGSGELATRICPQVPTKANVSGRLLSGLLDRVLEVGEEWDLAPCVGKLFKITVEASANGKGTRVTECTAID